MNKDDRLNLRARQMLDDPTLPLRDRVTNPDALLRQLAASVKGFTDAALAKRADVLAEITDEDLRARMAAAIDAVNG